MSLQHTLQPGLSALTDFSSILSKALGSLDENAGNLRNSLEGVIDHVDQVKNQVNNHDERLRKLELETELQRESVERAMHLAAGLEKGMNNQLTDATKHLHKELVTQRTMTRMDMSNMRGRLTQNMSEAMSALTDTKFTPSKEPLFNPNLSANENMQKMVDRMAKLEETLLLQNTVNQHFSKVLSGDMTQKVYDSLAEEISSLNGDLQKSKTENESLKKAIKELKDAQSRQSRYMLDVLSSLGSKTKLQNLKDELKSSLRNAKINENFDDTVDTEEVPSSESKQDYDTSEMPVGNTEAAGSNIRKSFSQDPESTSHSKSSVERKKAPSSTAQTALQTASQTPLSNKQSLADSDGVEAVNMEYNDAVDDEQIHQGEGENAVKDMDDSVGFDDEDQQTLGDFSMAEESIAEEKRRQLEWQKSQILEVVASETHGMVDGLRMEYQQRLDELEAAIATFRRIAFVIDDLKINFDTIKHKVDALASGESIEEKMAKSMMDRIANVKELWNKVSVELCFALENVNDPDLDKEDMHDEVKQEDGESKPDKDLWENEDLESFGPKAFFIRAKDFSRIIDDNLEEFNPRDTLPLTLKKVIPTLLNIFNKGETMLEMDNKARQSESLDYCFDDLVCSDLTPSLKNYVNEAVQESLPILDEILSKHRLQQKVDFLLNELPKKADKQYLLVLESELKKMMASKVDHPEFVTVTSRLASSAEVQRLQSQLSDSFHGANHIHGYGATSTARRDTGGEDLSIELKNQPEFIELIERFDSLNHKFADMQVQCEKLVPKQEVHEALKAIVDEVKSVRRNYVPGPVFKEGLKSKADAKEVEK